MNSLERMRREIEATKDTPEFELDYLLLEVTEAIYRSMTKLGLSNSELADRLGTSRSYITKLLDGQENLTLKTLVRVANALEMKVNVRLAPRPAASAARRVTTAPPRAGNGSARKASAPRKRAVAARSRG